MERRQALDPEVIDAYDLFIHGHIDRRSFLDRVKRVAISTAAAAAIVDQLMPNYAAAQRVSPQDGRISSERVTVPSPGGYGTIAGLLVRPHPRAGAVGPERMPAVLVVHENRGLNPHIEDIARRVAVGGSFMAFAPDTLTSVGGYPGDEEKAIAMFAKLDQAKMMADLQAAAAWVKNRPESTGRLGVIGFCYGGGVANALAVRMGADLQAAVSFYGGAPPLSEVPKIKAAVQVHDGGDDKRLVDAWLAYRDALHAAGVSFEGYVYPGAGRGFNNDSTPQRYNKAAADLAWSRSISCFIKSLT